MCHSVVCKGGVLNVPCLFVESGVPQCCLQRLYTKCALSFRRVWCATVVFVEVQYQLVFSWSLVCHSGVYRGVVLNVPCLCCSWLLLRHHFVHHEFLQIEYLGAQV